MYQVLARRWRPQSFSELVGQSHIARTLSNAISSDRLAHAYIFAGLRGTGKTTVARILAKCLNCEKGPTTEPCGTCVSCEEVAESRSMDVLEIDAASRTKVEQTRELLEVVSYAPVRDRYKVLIIDEAHMLSKASFNALLKTLEEPPPNVVFILATTELHKVLPTIVSRCQVFEFRRLSPHEVAVRLRQICDEGDVKISDSSLERVARAGEGSVRDSLSQLERVLAFCGTEVDDDEVLRLLGAVRAQVLGEMISALARRDAPGMLTVLDGLLDEGHDLIHFWNELISAIRDLLLLDALPDRGELLSRPAEEAATLRVAAEGLSREDLNRVFQILADLEPGLKTSAQPRFLFEAALIRLATLGAVQPIEDLLAGLGSRPAPGQKKKPEALKPRSTPSSAPTSSTPPTPSATPTAAFVDAVRAARPMLGAMLAEAAISLDGGVLGITLTSGGEAFRQQLEQRESLGLLRKTAEELSGGAVEVRLAVEASGEAAAPPVPARAEASAAPPATPRSPARTPKTSGDPELLASARRDPEVRRLLDAFGAQVVEIQGPEGTE